MKVFFETSVLVTVVVDQLPNHEAALSCYAKYTRGRHRGACSTHSIAECYATLTALPLARKVQPAEARLMIAENFMAQLEVIDLPSKHYVKAIRRVSDFNLSSGVVYDALHLICAEEADCQRLYTYNLRHFERLRPKRVLISLP